MYADRGADALARALRAADVKRVFTLSGNHIMPVFDAAIDAGLQLVHVRHEAAAAHMADAHARITGEVGVALVTGGPGHANAISALYTATLAESPVDLLSGHAPHAEHGLGAFQEMAQAQIAAPLTKASWVCRSADEVTADVRRAFRIAKSGRPGAVHLSLPTDCLEEHAGPGIPAAEDDPEVKLAEADAKSIAERLAGARSPLVLTGPMSLTKAGRAQMRRLEEALGIPVVGMESPRGIADPSLGAFAEMLAKADRVLLLGKRLDYTLKFGRAPVLRAECELMHVDPEAQQIDRTQKAAGPRLVASAVADVFAAAETIARYAKKQQSGWRDEVRAAVDYRPVAWNRAASHIAERLHPVQALRPLQAILDSHPDSVFVCDGGEFGQWGLACLHAPNRVINGVAGPIGIALPFALAARLAKPESPVITVMGDGTFGFHAAEIDTAVRYGLPFLAVVGNDAKWNAEHQIQLRDYGPTRARGCELLPTRYDEVAVAFGAHGELVTRPDEFLPAARRALETKRPACLNVMIEGVPAPVIRR